VAPHPDSVEAVNSWLEFHNIDPLNSVHRSGSGDWVTLRISVDLAEKMLGTKYNVYRHTTSGEEVVRTLSYSLPKELHKHIDVIVPSTYFGTIRTMKVTSFLQPTLQNIVQDSSSVPEGQVDPSCNTTITPACLRALYNTSSYVPVSTNVNKIAVTGYLDEFANYDDLQVGGNLLRGFLNLNQNTSRHFSRNFEVMQLDRILRLFRSMAEGTISPILGLRSVMKLLCEFIIC
jgi:tripeptidyl-peptidase-1